ncbi:MAG: flagellar M-ring protein FliF [Desulfobacteraceae bacterium 4572_130]|nr:MAG: flagellar M-ring protein FliF [Desulfobacteraceae bacterium 4572_130]
MKLLFEHIVRIYKEMSLLKRIAFGVLILFIIAGFTTMFMWANKTTYKAAYTGLSETDASAIVEKLKEIKIPYKLESGGSIILVPEREVYNVRLSMAKDGIPKGSSGVGYEIFDKTDFGITEYVQKINNKRALQGELARTIIAFDEVKDARVMIVLPKDSVFIEEIKKPSASILLELKSDLEEEKVAAIAHLVASAVQDLTPKLVTIVDTTGKILFEGKSDEERKARLKEKNLADTQYKYKIRFEENIADRIQTMLERIVGKEKAIVRVTAEMDFSQNNVDEEIYDPYERDTTFIRSQKKLAEDIQKPINQPGDPSSVNPIVPPGGQRFINDMEIINKREDTVNYEISKRISKKIKPMAVLRRLSVAAVVDGKYEKKDDEAGNIIKVYVPRSDIEMNQFKDIVLKAMGFNEVRQDQISMQSFPFASIDEIKISKPELTGWELIKEKYGRTIINILLILLILFIILMIVFIILRRIKKNEEEAARLAALEQEKDAEAAKESEDDKDDDKEDKEDKETDDMRKEKIIPNFAEMTPDEQRQYLAEMKPEERRQFFNDMPLEERRKFLLDMTPEERKQLFEDMTPEERQEFIDTMTPIEKGLYLATLSISEKAAYYANTDVNKSANIIKGWITAEGEKNDK